MASPRSDHKPTGDCVLSGDGSGRCRSARVRGSAGHPPSTARCNGSPTRGGRNGSLEPLGVARQGWLALLMLCGELTPANLAYSLLRYRGVFVSTYQVVLSYEGDHQDCVADNLTHDEAVKVFKESIEKLKDSEEAEFIEIWEMDDDENMVDTVMEHSFQ
jgi:hypothetical protein